MRRATTDQIAKCAVALTRLAAVTLMGTSTILAGVIHESATLGTPGQTGGAGVASNQFLGSRFHIDGPVNVTGIGGHLVTSNGTLFGAIVPLANSTSALPTGSPFDGSELLTFTFDAGTPSSDFLTPVSGTLPAGDYALIFGGSGQFGATGSGNMPHNDTDLPGASYFFWNGSNWNNGGFNNARFVIEGDPVTDVPTTSTWGLAILVALLSLGLLATLLYRRRLRAAS